MGFSIGYNANGDPVMTLVGDLPEVSPPGAPWQILGGGGGVYRPEYSFAQGAVTGTPATGLTWGAKVLSAGSTDRRVAVSGWRVNAAVFAQDGTPLQPLTCQVADEWTWSVEVPKLEPGPARAVIVLVTAQNPTLITTLRTFSVLLVAGV